MNFDDETEFARLEDRAIDGLLKYSDFPPPEYKYFDQLARLGVDNRNGKDGAECVAEQDRLRRLYRADREQKSFFLNMAKQMQANIRAGQLKIIDVDKATTAHDKLCAALEAIGLMICDDTFVARNLKQLD